MRGVGGRRRLDGGVRSGGGGGVVVDDQGRAKMRRIPSSAPRRFTASHPILQHVRSHWPMPRHLSMSSPSNRIRESSPSDEISRDLVFYCTVCFTPLAGSGDADQNPQFWLTSCGHIVCSSHIFPDGGERSTNSLSSFEIPKLIQYSSSRSEQKDAYLSALPALRRLSCWSPRIRGLLHYPQ